MASKNGVQKLGSKMGSEIASKNGIKKIISFVLSNTGFVLCISGFVLILNGLILNKNLCVLKFYGLVPNMNGSFLNMNGFVNSNSKNFVQICSVSVEYYLVPEFPPGRVSSFLDHNWRVGRWQHSS